MKYILTFFLVILAACGTGNMTDGDNNYADNENSMTGYVADVGDERIMVVEKKLQEPFSEIPIEELSEKAGNAISFRVEGNKLSESLQTGEKVEVTHGAVAESYPEQSTASQIKRVVDEDDDIILQQDQKMNLIELETFRQAVQNGKEEQIRMVQYTTEGDPVFMNINYVNKQIEVVIDSSEDQYGSEENAIRHITCSQLEYFLTESQTVSFEIVNCNNSESTLLVADIPLAEIIIPDQSYHKVEVKAGDNILFNTSDQKEINEII
ncbi:DUF4362 domain-containing protein [Gracilibacillus oryzae]|uniref:DUF4362 domain-containing protein n=1 Tax=Gracilibacillus oryzae TaxID=1672701 RepID=A0A7C8GW86_9BACI|nr:DUF4362 domain-containing protein [Gracilibacillus oryzae]KAB8139343.1 DUF4362 domain-containing protein [Gracilibacillus oryzae]